VQRENVKRLYFITSISNVPSILEHGLLSHRRASRLPHTDISLASVQDIRATKRVPGGRVLHEYACVYFCARNPMLYKRSREIPDAICVLGLHHSLLDLPGAIVTDHNAACHVAYFAPYPEGLDAVDEEQTFAQSWDHADADEKRRHRYRMCAEVLVPDGIHPSFIDEAFVGSATGKVAFDALATNLPCRVWRYMFFRG
jgi:hypothetical protein